MTALHNLQGQFTAYVRHPGRSPIPDGFKPERIAVYAEVMFNNIEAFLSNNFPVIHAILTAQQWQQLVRDFYATHASSTPYFSAVPEEFLNYLQDERHNPDDYPFLLELAHYEWVEMALSVAQEELALNTSCTDLLHKRLSLSPLAWLLAYQYPVAQLSPDYLPSSPPEQPTLLLVHRDAADEVKFIALNAMTFQLLNLIQETPGLSSQAYLEQLSASIPSISATTLLNGGLEILENFAAKHIVTVLAD